ncbi:hypothetical protein N656DRAFT_102058 [Canariomyces notabilis]|uniref:Uncharacterized protein n=1 Tax=Canariomyces notabilis TaxID=2074819 RepID=A0AAN6TE12_9PEZI|nr:hypothetical protein N656DRAFT_102058 [Canariomyces arenarius]
MLFRVGHFTSPISPYHATSPFLLSILVLLKPPAALDYFYLLSSLLSLTTLRLNFFLVYCLPAYLSHGVFSVTLVRCTVVQFNIRQYPFSSRSLRSLCACVWSTKLALYLVVSKHPVTMYPRPRYLPTYRSPPCFLEYVQT